MSALPRPQPRPGVLDIDAYTPGKSTAPGVERIFKLSSNETPLGPSPQAIAAYRNIADHLHDYPDGAATEERGGTDFVALVTAVLIGSGPKGSGVSSDERSRTCGVQRCLPTTWTLSASVSTSVNARAMLSALMRSTSERTNPVSVT